MDISNNSSKDAQNLPVGASILVKCFIRTYADGSTSQIFGAIVEGAEHLNMGIDGTQLIAATLIVEGGMIKDCSEELNCKSREVLMSNYI
jgi:hypothetical protein